LLVNLLNGMMMHGHTNIKFTFAIGGRVESWV